MKQNILVIEDNTETRECMSELLTLEGFNVSTSEDGSLALIQLVSNLPDLIICDIHMPVMDGFEFFSHLKSNPRIRNIPFMFSTTKSEPMDIQKAKALGVDYYLIKPFDGVDLLTTINSVLKIRQSSDG
ncbi:MAG: response regulator [Mucilaginibacter sp.]|uniref:response regulator n=1 Tax=Mucilaginibacter sp. TaxID=1882438 RepID=UPI003265281D